MLYLIGDEGVSKYDGQGSEQSQEPCLELLVLNLGI